MKLAMITGGSRGLGEALVEIYKNEDFEVIEFSRSGGSASHLHCDFSNPEEAAETIDEVFSGIKKADYAEVLLINNAGTIEPIGPIANYDVNSWITNIDINFNSAIIASGLFLKHFQRYAYKKVIATVSSAAAIRAKAGWSLYCAAKAGLEQFCRTLAKEQDAEANPIRIVTINPGVMDTQMQSVIRSSKQEDFPELGRFIGLKNEGLLLPPQSVAKNIYNFLDGHVENGAEFIVEGG